MNWVYTTDVVIDSENSMAIFIVINNNTRILRPDHDTKNDRITYFLVSLLVRGDFHGHPMQ